MFRDNSLFELANPVRKEYERWLTLLGEDDPYAGSMTLGLHDVLKAHFVIVDFFYAQGAGIGGVGPRDPDLLHSALSRQTVQFGGRAKWTTIYDICATLMYGLIMNHPFHDANKRTAFLSSLLYLYRHKRTPSVTHQQYEDFTVEVADRKLDRYPRYRAYKEKGDDAEIHFISHFLRSKTRELDKRFYTVTYRDLNTILRRFNYGLEDPDGNYIRIMRYGTKKLGLFRRREEATSQVIGTIGFPGWTRQVKPSVMNTVREKTGLTHKNGYDSQVFYRGLDDLQELIAHYQEPLLHLAYR